MKGLHGVSNDKLSRVQGGQNEQCREEGLDIRLYGCVFSLEYIDYVGTFSYSSILSSRPLVKSLSS